MDIELQKAIVTSARSWVGTRFHHQGRLKKTAQHKGGVDCLGLLVGVASELGLEKDIDGQPVLLAQCDRTDYGRLPDGVALQQKLAALLQPITISEIMPGDVLLFHFEGNPQHLAIVSDYVHGGHGIIHCYAQARGVVEHALDAAWKKRIVAAFRF